MSFKEPSNKVVSKLLHRAVILLIWARVVWGEIHVLENELNFLTENEKATSSGLLGGTPLECVFVGFGVR